jgi:hypothetical protein
MEVPDRKEDTVAGPLRTSPGTVTTVERKPPKAPLLGACRAWSACSCAHLFTAASRRPGALRGPASAAAKRRAWRASDIVVCMFAGVVDVPDGAVCMTKNFPLRPASSSAAVIMSLASRPTGGPEDESNNRMQKTTGDRQCLRPNQHKEWSTILANPQDQARKTRGQQENRQ